MGMLGFRVMAPWSRTTGLALNLGLQLPANGKVGPRDGELSVVHHLVSTPSLSLQIRPGINLPLGGVGRALSFTPLSTGSFDPTLGVDLVVGGQWMFVASVGGRVPVYAGFDDVRQGAFGQVSLRAAVRAGPAVPWLGVSGAGNLRDDFGGGAFREIAATGGVQVAVHQRWGLSAHARVPLVGGPDGRAYAAAVGLRVNVVVGKTKEAEDDHHGEGDTHDHVEGDDHDHE